MSREGLLAAVAANPEDDAPRLVFADWLDEFGDELDRHHAAVIRAQIDLERLPPDDDRRAELAHRTSWSHGRLWDIRKRLWSSSGVHSGLSRGFPARVGFDWNDKRKGRLSEADLADLAAAIDQLPIRAFAGDVLGCGPTPLGQSGLELPAAWPHLARLTALEATCGFTPYEERGDFAAGLRAIAASPFAGGLRRLKLGWWQIDLEALAAVLSSPNWPRLAELDLRFENDPIAVEALALVPRTPFAARLTRLNAAWVDVSAGSIRWCLDRGRLQSLAFGVAEEDDGGVGPLLGADGLSGLRELRVTGEFHGFDTDESPSGMDDCRPVPHVAELLASSRLSGLETLRVQGVALGDEGVRALVRGPVGRSLVSLDVQQCGLSGEGLRALRPLLAEGRLRRLAIDHNEITRADAEELASWPEYGRLHEIDAGFFNHMGDEGRQALEESPHRHPWLQVH